MKEFERIMRDAWEEDPKAFIGELIGGICAVAIVPLTMILAVLIGGK